MYKRIFFIWLIGITLGLVTQFAHKTDCGELIFATVDLLPYNYSENGKVVGTSTELLQQIFDKTGYKMKVKIFPPVRALKMLEKGMVTSLFSLTQTSERL